jgi:hypothetical protein
MIAPELLDTKLAGVIQPDPAAPKPTSRARRMALDRSETCSLVMMLDAWLCTRLGLAPEAVIARLDPAGDSAAPCIATPPWSRLAVGLLGRCQGCETTDRLVIGSACYGFECVNNLDYGDRCRNLYRRGCPQKRLHSLQIFQDALLQVTSMLQADKSASTT